MRTLMTACGTALLALLTLLAMGGVARAVTVGDLVADPDAYNGQSVTVTGTVERALPVYDQSGYELREGRAKVTVLSPTGPPAIDAHLSVSGTVHVFHEGDGGPEENNWPPYIVESSRAPAP
jgi:hypothetical protein